MSRRTLPPLNALRAFEVSGRHLNFRAASEELGVTQGAVAQQVRLLEDRLGLALFTRLPRGLALTPAGATYLAAVSRAFDGLQEATEELALTPAHVTLSVPPTFAVRLLMPRLPQLAAHLPEVSLRTIASEALADFDRDGVDLAVRLGEGRFASGLEARLLFRQELIPVASPHLVAGLALPLDLAALGRLPLLHDAHDHWRVFLGLARKPGGAEFNQTALALEAALAGQGAALACRAFVEADLAAGRLVQLCETSLTGAAHYYLVRKRRTAHPAAVEAVWDWCCRTYAAEGGEAA